MGVWIETHCGNGHYKSYDVTPFVGVWIETLWYLYCLPKSKSHPSWVCGLKHEKIRYYIIGEYVTPFVGVWIETDKGPFNIPTYIQSHPSWVCGLKP